MGPWFVLSDTAARNREYALALVICVGAVLVGYGVFRLVPEHHYPRVAGWLAANVIVATLALLGVEVAGETVVLFFLISGFVVALAADE